MSHIAFQKTKHRPWPLPKSPWRWRQSWCDLLFAHWPVPAKKLRPYVPEPLHIQEFDGTSWIGIVPFRMEGVMLRPLPDLPWISAFPELNVRLYVEYAGKPGVWFLSLDATNSLAVWAARKFFYLPYYNAEIHIETKDRQLHYHSKRKKSPAVEFKSIYEPVSDPYQAEAESLEQWLTERYCLYAQSPNGDIYRSEIHHLPWPLQMAKAEFERNHLLHPYHFSLPDISPLLHFAKRLDVVIWPPVKVVTD